MTVAPKQHHDELLHLTLPELVEKRAEMNPDSTALILDSTHYTYSQILWGAQGLHRFLHHHGVQAGDRVAILAGNSIEFVWSWLGVLRGGMIEVPLNTAARGMSLEHLLADSGSKVLIVEEEHLPNLREARLPSTLETIVVIQCGAGVTGVLPTGPNVQVLIFHDVLSASEGLMPDMHVSSASDVAAIIYTSGTTGPSKGVTCPHGHLRGLAIDTIESLKMTDRDVLYDAHPLFHAHGQGQAFFTCLLLGIPLVSRRKFSVSGFLADLNDYRITTAFLVGAAGLVLKQDRVGPFPELRIVCAIPIPRGKQGSLEKLFGAPVVDLYGMTEMGVITANPIGRSIEGSCGLATPRREVRIVDEEDRLLSAGEKGEVVVRSLEPWTTFLGYFGNESATVESTKNLWFHTGDYAFQDQSGYLHFIDRKKDALRRRGENISSYEVELVITALQGVLECAVLPWPSPVGEDDVWAVIVQVQGANLSAKDVITHCEANLEVYAMPRYIQFEDALPKTATEKVQKYKLKEDGLSPTAYDREQGVEISC